MVGRFVPFRLLTSGGGRGGAGASFPVIAGIFPFHLKYHFLSSTPSPARPFSFRAAPMPKRPRGEFRARGVPVKGKSLVEDEAELSDWVGDLKHDSFRRGLTGSDDDDDDDEVEDTGRRRGSRNLRKGDGFLGKYMDSAASSGSGRSSLKGPRPRPGPAPAPGRGPGPRLRERDNTLTKGRDPFLSKRRFDNDDERSGRLGERPKREKRGDSSSSFMPPRRGGRDAEVGYRHGKGGRKADFTALKDEEDEDEDTDSSVGEDEEDDEDENSDFENDFFGDKEQKIGVSPAASSHATVRESAPLVSRNMEGKNDSYLSETRFDKCSISPLSLKGIQAAGYERMTVVQEATLPIILKGKDVLAKAKTGTGKTVAFLLPVIEVIIKSPPVDRGQKWSPINALVICPTRELASQAAAEAETLLKYHASIGVQVVIGGTRLAIEQKRLQASPCQILVATPGRLRDHLENTPAFATRLSGVKVLVLDEADRLLDMGFRKDIEKIVASVSKQRQTLLFSATVPDEVHQIGYIAMKRDYEFINTVEEGSEETHTQVRQMHLVAPLEKHFPMLYGILTDHISENVDYKVIVFCTTAMVTRLVADLLSELKLNVREIHSRKPQSYRTRVSKEFKESKGLILVSSDVSARGVDYPDVTLVIQVGVPSDKAQYIHRLGRTGRKGKEGEGILMLAPWEEFFLTSIKDLPITKASLPLIDPDTYKKVERALAHVEMKNKESAYQAWLGYYNSNRNIGQDKFKLVTLANEFSRSMGLDVPPAIPKLILRKMGLNNVPGLRTK